jgi:hypothetical protein
MMAFCESWFGRAMEMEKYFLYGAIIITWLLAVTFFPIYEPDPDLSFPMVFYYVSLVYSLAIFIGAAALVSLLVPTLKSPLLLLLYAAFVQVYLFTVFSLRALLRDRPLKS